MKGCNIIYSTLLKPKCVQIFFKINFLPHREHVSCVQTLMPFGVTVQCLPWIIHNTYVHSVDIVWSLYLLMQMWWIIFCYLTPVLGVVIFLPQTSLSEINFVSPSCNVTPSKLVINYEGTAGAQRNNSFRYRSVLLFDWLWSLPKAESAKTKEIIQKVIPQLFVSFWFCYQDQKTTTYIYI
jgi:hypothetical protein